MEFLLLLTPFSTNTGGESCEFVLAGDGVEVETVLDISLFSIVVVISNL